jgi:hypothetical protein
VRVERKTAAELSNPLTTVFKNAWILRSEQAIGNDLPDFLEFCRP